MKKLVLFFFLIGTFAFGGCNDSFNGSVAEKTIKQNYDSNDDTLSNTILKIVDSMEKNNKFDENTLLSTQDLKNLHIKGLVELKNSTLLIENQNRLIFHQR